MVRLLAVIQNQSSIHTFGNRITMAKKKKKGSVPRTKEQTKPRTQWTFSRVALIIFSIIMLLAMVIPTIIQIFVYQ